ncbi:MAG: Uma2 family endonuclease [Anaerolineae bacterium]|nr:Uma2 family endonuclease [Anaerolineae bacterium]MCO5203416.1 Uma2 family endonuclease [Anaerolineae bacterium]
MLRDSAVNEPVWEIATLFPPQNQWSIDDYLELDARTNHLIEYSCGNIEILSLPSIRHQWITGLLYRLLFSFIAQRRLGVVFIAPTKVALWESKVREPDVFFVSNDNVQFSTEQWFEKIDLAIEVVSPDDPARDLEKKRREYAQAGIPEYWIVDPRSDEILVLTLGEKWYDVHGVFGAGETATSVLLDGFAVAVDDVFAEPPHISAETDQ